MIKTLCAFFSLLQKSEGDTSDV